MSYNTKNLSGEDLDDDTVLIIKVSASSDPQAVASSITNAFYDNPEVTMRAVGAGAVNQAVKAIAIARGYIAPKARDLICRPGFVNIESYSGDGNISAIVFRLSLL